MNCSNQPELFLDHVQNIFLLQWITFFQKEKTPTYPNTWICSKSLEKVNLKHIDSQMVVQKGDLPWYNP